MKTYTLFFFGLFLSLRLMSQEHDLKKYGMAEDDRNRLHQLEVGASAPEIKSEQDGRHRRLAVFIHFDLTAAAQLHA